MRTPIIALLLLSLAAPARAQAPDTAVVMRAWRAIRDNYADTTFGGANWESLGRAAAAGGLDTRALLSRLHDPWTRQLGDAPLAALFQEASGGAHVGVGLPELLCLDYDSSGRRLMVVTPVPGSPAARAGLQPGDVVTRIGTRSTDGLTLADAAHLLRGARGTAVAVRVRRGAREQTLRLTRDSIPARRPAATGRLLAGPDGVGYVALGWFTAAAGDEVRALVDSLTHAGARRFVLDLRDNPGGSLAAATAVAGVFLGDAPLVTIVGRTTGGQEVRAAGPAATAAPLVVLIGRGTASAAEVVAGALQHHRRARLAGERSFGKGLVHSFALMGDGSAVMYTSGRLRTPGGRDILGNGIEPDVKATGEAVLPRAVRVLVSG